MICTEFTGSARCLHRRRFTREMLSLCVGATTLGSAGLGHAAAYPDRPIKFIVPFSAGGNTDSVGRLLAAGMGSRLGQPIVVDNRAGAGGSLGAGLVAQGAADGYTLLIGSNGPLTINPFVMAKLAYRPLDDFAPIVLAGTVPHVFIVYNELAANTLQDLITLSKQQLIGCATSGVGSATHLTLARFNARTGARIDHVPYRGGNSLVPDLLGGAIQVAAMELSTALPLHKSGKARILGVADARRSPLAADVPTFIESGVTGFTALSYVGLLAPVQTPSAVLEMLEKAALAALTTPDTMERIQGLGMQLAEPADRTADGFAKLLRADYERSAAAVKLVGVKPE